MAVSYKTNSRNGDRCREQLPPCPVCAGLECLCRPRFFPGQLLSDEDLNRLQRYITGKNKLHNRYLHGWGVACGLEVVCDACKPTNVVVRTGYALSPCGDDIVLCGDQSVNICELIARCRETREPVCDPPYQSPPQQCLGGTEEWVLAVCYDETPSRGTTALTGAGDTGCGCGPGCGCGGTSKGTSGGGCGCSAIHPVIAGTTKMPVSKPGKAKRPQCEPTQICEGFNFKVYKKPTEAPQLGRYPLPYANRSALMSWMYSRRDTLGPLLDRVLCCVLAAMDLRAQVREGRPTDGRALLTAYAEYVEALREFARDFAIHDCAALNRMIEVVNEANQFIDSIGSRVPSASEQIVTVQRLLALDATWINLVAECFCSALLPACPEPATDNCVPLALVTIQKRDCRVVEICNWSERKLLITWPTVSYWLSWLPWHRVREWIARLCCGDTRSNASLLRMLQVLLGAAAVKTSTTVSSVGTATVGNLSFGAPSSATTGVNTIRPPGGGGASISTGAAAAAAASAPAGAGGGSTGASSGAGAGSSGGGQPPPEAEFIDAMSSPNLMQHLLEGFERMMAGTDSNAPQWAGLAARLMDGRALAPLAGNAAVADVNVSDLATHLGITRLEARLEELQNTVAEQKRVIDALQIVNTPQVIEKEKTMNEEISTLSGRPRFFEGQYLSADDLSAVVAYLSAADARHALAAHTHGIVIGLYLTERAAPGGANRREVILQPGFAWDGFGRPIVVTQPTRLPEALCASIPYAPLLDEPVGGSPAVGRLIKVWLAYSETETRAPAPGFESCASDDQNSRIREGFDFVIGEFPPGPTQHDDVVIGTETLPAEQQLRRFDSAAPAIPDGSVPHQTFPENPRRRWLVPVGYVRWLARPGDLGFFIQRDLVAADNVTDRIRAARRYAGAVTEYIEAADGNIVLHRRDEDPLAPNKFASLLASGQDGAEHRGNLVWVEGNLRVGGDAKIAGGKLHLRDAAGLTQNTALYLERGGDGTGAAGQRELRAVIGPATQTNNLFVVGPHDTATPPAVTAQLAVVSSGRVGVNTATPVATFDVRGDWDGSENGAVRVAGTLPTIRFGGITGHDNEQWTVQAEAAGTLKFAHRIAPAQWKPALYLAPNLGILNGLNEAGVGVRSDTPRNPLAVRAFGASEELVSFEDPGGVTRWHINQRVNGTAAGFNIAETGVADSRFLIEAGGDVGMGTVAPTNRLHVVGNTGIRQNYLYLSGGVDGSSLTYNAHRDAANANWVFPDPARKSMTIELDDFNNATRFEVWSNATGTASAWTSRFKILGDSGNVFMCHNGGNVGIGTGTPAQKLHVAGQFLRVDGLANEQAYLGGDGFAGDVQLGSLNAAISRVVLYNPPTGQPMDLTCRDINARDITGDDISAVAWHNISDIAVKRDIADIKSPLATLQKLRGVTFRWQTSRIGDSDIGLIAQEVQKVLPQLVRDTPRGATVSYMSLVPLLIESVKELAGEVAALREEVAELRKKSKSSKSDKPGARGK